MIFNNMGLKSWLAEHQLLYFNQGLAYALLGPALDTPLLLKQLLYQALMLALSKVYSSLEIKYYVSF